ncbi:MAG: MFS transporter [Bryobacteraceae bacterium]|nr:MFS transporter [Bryobacteraceae bacterium]
MPHLRWWIAGLLFLATIINYVDRQALSVLAPLLRDEFGMSNTDYSRIVSAFMLAYLIMQTGSGRLMDWVGTRAGFSLCIAWWSAAAMLHAAARSALSFGLFRFLLGLGEAGNWPGGVKAVSEWFPARERAFAIGFFNSGSTLGAVIAPPLVAWLAIHYGWGNAFLITGALGFVWLALWLPLYRTPDRHPWITAPELDHIRSGRESAGLAERIRWVRLFSYRQVWGLVLGRMLADPVWWFYVFWLPEYLKRERQFSLAMIGYFAWIPFLGATVGCLVGGAASGWLIRRGMPVLRARKTVMFASAVLMMSGIPAVLATDANVAIALITVATFAYSTWAANILTLPADLFPPGIVASVSGLSGTGAATGGMVFTLVIGAVVDRFSYLPVFTAAGLMPLAAFALIAWGVRSTPSRD